MIRAVASAALIVIAGFLIVRFCIRPLRCGTAEHALEQSTLQLAEHSDSPGIARYARQNLDAARACITLRPTDVALYMIAAANARLIGDDRAAAAYYKEALRYDQRPELYVNLGNTLSRLGQRHEAIDSLMRAYEFWPQSGDEIEDPFVHDEVMRRIGIYESDLKHRL